MGDEELLRRLRDLLAPEPVPAHVVAAAEAALSWRTVDAELAALVEDSAELVGPGAVRAGAGDVRLLTFEAPALTIECEITPTGSRRRLLGQLVPAAAAEVTVRHRGGQERVRADDLGRLPAVEVDAGPVSLRCALPGQEATPVVTDWVPL